MNVMSIAKTLIWLGMINPNQEKKKRKKMTKEISTKINTFLSDMKSDYHNYLSRRLLISMVH